MLKKNVKSRSKKQKKFANEYERTRRIYGETKAELVAKDALRRDRSGTADRGLKIARNRENIRKGVGIGLLGGASGIAASASTIAAMSTPISAAVGLATAGMFVTGGLIANDSIKTAAARKRDNKNRRDVAAKINAGSNGNYAVKQRYLLFPGTYYVDANGKKIPGTDARYTNTFRYR